MPIRASCIKTQAILVNVVSLVTVVNIVTWGIPGHPDNTDATGAICKGHIMSNTPQLLCVHACIS